MGIIIGANFNLSSRKFLDDRQQCPSLEALQLNEGDILYPLGFEVYCIKEKCWYQNTAETDEDAPIWTKRVAEVTNIEGGAIIDDENVSDETVYSSYKVETIKEEMEVLVSQTNDDIDDIDNRLTEAELDILRVRTDMEDTSVNLEIAEYDVLRLTTDNVQKCAIEVDTNIILPSDTTNPLIRAMIFIKKHPLTLTFTSGDNVQQVITTQGDMYYFTFNYSKDEGNWLGKYEIYSIND